ncbi:MAG: GNAT family N-acetyltransferase [Bacillaceae bacterium]|nr:GNAT family N-acetyltransferase [Bacillaceae bacterium]
MAKIQSITYMMKNNQPFVIQNAETHDAEQILAYTKNVMAESKFLMTEASEFNLTVEQEQILIDQLLNDENKLMICAKLEDEIIGTLDFHNGSRKRNLHQGYFGMSVAKQYRGQGVGKALVETLIAWAEENPVIEKVGLEVFAENLPAIRLYESFGFLEEGRKKHAAKINGKTHDLILMAKFFVS